MAPINNHPLRFALTNELHARPFPSIAAPSAVAYLAITPEHGPGGRNRKADRDHLIALIDRYGAPHPQPDATHYFGKLGNYQLRWESHTEFFTYAIIGQSDVTDQWNTDLFDVYPKEWLGEAPGSLIASALVRVEQEEAQAQMLNKLTSWFVPESLAVSKVLESRIIVASDFRIDHAGHSRFAIFAKPDIDERRTGQVVQQLCEIETYKTMAMLGFSHAGSLAPKMTDMDKRFLQLTSEVSGTLHDPDATLHALLEVSAELEGNVAQSSFRFGATTAYESIVYQRISGLRETRFAGLQTIGDFMSRRFDPAMRTIQSTQDRLSKMADRAQRAADMLRTRVDVQRSAQNQALLQSMDKRAGLQLRLQRTVEGLSVVAISYYAVNLVMFLLAPVAGVLESSATIVKAIATPIVVVSVWLLMRRVKRVILPGADKSKQNGER